MALAGKLGSQLSKLFRQISEESAEVAMPMQHKGLPDLTIEQENLLYAFPSEQVLAEEQFPITPVDAEMDVVPPVREDMGEARKKEEQTPAFYATMTTEELQEQVKLSNIQENEDMITALGNQEKVDRFNKLSKQMDSSNIKLADEAFEKFNSEFGDLTDEQDILIYGRRGVGPPTADEFERLFEARRSIDDLEDEEFYDDSEVVRVLIHGLLDFDLTPEKISSLLINKQGNMKTQEGATYILGAFQEAKNRGINLDDEIIEAMKLRGYSESDAYEMLSPFLTYIKKQPPELKKLVSPIRTQMDKLVPSQPQRSALRQQVENLGIGTESETVATGLPDPEDFAYKLSFFDNEGEALKDATQMTEIAKQWEPQYKKAQAQGFTIPLYHWSTKGQPIVDDPRGEGLGFLDTTVLTKSIKDRKDDTGDIGIHLGVPTAVKKMADMLQYKVEAEPEQIKDLRKEITDLEEILSDTTTRISKASSRLSRTNRKKELKYFRTRLSQAKDKLAKELSDWNPRGPALFPVVSKLDKVAIVPDIGRFKLPNDWLDKLSTLPVEQNLNNARFGILRKSNIREDIEKNRDVIKNTFDEYEFAYDDNKGPTLKDLKKYTDENNPFIFWPEDGNFVYLKRKGPDEFDSPSREERFDPLKNMSPVLWKQLMEVAHKFHLKNIQVTREHLKKIKSPTTSEKEEGVLFVPHKIHPSLIEEWNEALRKILEEGNYDAFAYPNHTEDKGALSYMFLDPKKVKSIFAKEFDPESVSFGKNKGGVVDMRHGGRVGAAVVAASLMASGGQAGLSNFETPEQIADIERRREQKRKTLSDFETPEQVAEMQRKIDENRKLAQGLGFKNISEYYKADYEQKLGKAKDLNAAYWEKYGPMGNFQSQKMPTGQTETQFVYPPGYNLSDETITEQNKLIKNAFDLRNQEIKTQWETEGFTSLDMRDGGRVGMQGGGMTTLIPLQSGETPPIPKMNPLRVKERVMASTLKEIADAEGTEVLNTPPYYPILPLGSKKNNPGNLEVYGNWAGIVGSYADQRREEGKSPFAKFSHPVMGLRALAKDFRTKIKRHKGDIEKIFKQYAPESENKTQSYINFVQSKVGKKKITEEDLESVIHAVIKFENTREDRDYYLNNPQWIQEGIELSEINMPHDLIAIEDARDAYIKFKKEQGRPIKKPRIKSR